MERGVLCCFLAETQLVTGPSRRGLPPVPPGREGGREGEREGGRRVGHKSPL